MPTADVEELLKKIERNPVDMRAHFNLGRRYRKLKKNAEAEKCFRRALELKSDWADAHASLGDVLSVRKQAAEAIIEYSTAIRQRPKFGFPKAQQNLELNMRRYAGAEGEPLPEEPWFSALLKAIEGVAVHQREVGAAREKEREAWQQKEQAEKALRRARSLDGILETVDSDAITLKDVRVLEKRLKERAKALLAEREVRQRAGPRRPFLLGLLRPETSPRLPPHRLSRSRARVAARFEVDRRRRPIVDARRRRPRRVPRRAAAALALRPAAGHGPVEALRALPARRGRERPTTWRDGQLGPLGFLRVLRLATFTPDGPRRFKRARRARPRCPVRDRRARRVHLRLLDRPPRRVHVGRALLAGHARRGAGDLR